MKELENLIDIKKKIEKGDRLNASESHVLTETLNTIINKSYASQQMPSEEEIEKEADKLWPSGHPSDFIDGANYVKQHLKQQENQTED